jgi:O-antigen ligase
LGVGLANYEHFFQIYSFDNATKLYNADRAAHSLYLELMAERGLLGLIAYMGAVVALMSIVTGHAIRLIKRGVVQTGYLVLSLVAAAAVYYLTALFLHDVHSGPMWCLVGLMIASTKIETDNNGQGWGAG